jgi:hypothetical protein
LMDDVQKQAEARLKEGEEGGTIPKGAGRAWEEVEADGRRRANTTPRRSSVVS